MREWRHQYCWEEYQPHLSTNRNVVCFLLSIQRSLPAWSKKLDAYAITRAPPVPEIEHTDDSVHSLIDVDSPHISSVPSDYETQSVKTDTQAERLEHETEARERQAEETASKAKAKASAAKDKAKAGKSAGKIRENADNPVVVGNAITVGLLGTALGVGAYRKYTAGELTWKVVGAWAGVVGLFAVGDYYINQYLFKKYPPKN